MIVLSLCDRSGVFVSPWLEAGYECWCVDLQHPPGETREGRRVLVGADVRTWLPPREDFAFCAAFPPCTHLAVSGARWFKHKGLRALSEAIDIFGACVCVCVCEWTGAPWFCENPVSTVSTYFRKPDYSFDPCDYGDPYTKRTCLWSGGGFVMPPTHPVEPTEGSKMHLLAPSPGRAVARSVTPAGFARAVYEANAQRVAA